MTTKPSFWQRIGLHDWFLKKEADLPVVQEVTLTPDDVYKYIVQKFEESIAQLSFANRIVFFHEYIICFNVDDYNSFMANKKGLFGLIVQESVKEFYTILKAYKLQGKTVEPSANKWVFRFVSHPDYPKGDKSFIGKLLPGTTQQKEDNLRVTYIPRQTGMAKTFDINEDILGGFTFYSEGYYEVPFRPDLVTIEGRLNTADHAVLARFEAIIPDRKYAGKKMEYFMRDEEITISGVDETREGSNIFLIPSEWVNSPHLSIKFNRSYGKFYVASFGEKTVLNEHELKPGTAKDPLWIELPVNSRMVLNGIVGVNIFKS